MIPSSQVAALYAVDESGVTVTIGAAHAHRRVLSDAVEVAFSFSVAGAAAAEAAEAVAPTVKDVDAAVLAAAADSGRGDAFVDFRATAVTAAARAAPSSSSKKSASKAEGPFLVVAAVIAVAVLAVTGYCLCCRAAPPDDRAPAGYAKATEAKGRELAPHAHGDTAI